MAIYEIMNPSDPYTIEGDDLAVVCAATIILGRGQYGLETETGEHVLPVLFLLREDGINQWILETFGASSLDAFIADIPRDKLADALDSVLIGQVKERQTFYEGLSLIDDPAKKRQWWESWHDKRRSSMNDIGSRAKRLAKAFRESAS